MPTSLQSVRLPADSTLLPLFSGRLLVSPGHAVFCRIPPAAVSGVQKVLNGQTPLKSLPAALRDDLEAHGFLGPPLGGEPLSPTVQIQLTNECNLDCIYCCTNSGCARKKELTRAQCQRVIRGARNFLGPQGRVSLLGGEPLMVDWAFDIGAEMCDLELSGCIFTNGLPLNDPEKARRAAELSRRGMEIRVSLAGPTAPLCDALSGAARFEQAISGLHQLAAHGGKAHVDLMLVPQHKKATAEHFHTLRGRLPADFPIALGVCYVSGRETGEHVFESVAEMEETFDLIAFGAGEAIAAPQPQKIFHRREGCTCALGHHLHVRSDGALFPCFKMEEKIGQLENVDFARAMQAHRENPHPARTLAVCADCALNTLCGGGCRSENILYTGDSDTPLCDAWRPRVISELLAEDRPDALDWPLAHLAAEARRRGIDAPTKLEIVRPSRHLW